MLPHEMSSTAPSFDDPTEEVLYLPDSTESPRDSSGTHALLALISSSQLFGAAPRDAEGPEAQKEQLDELTYQRREKSTHHPALLCTPSLQSPLALMPLFCSETLAHTLTTCSATNDRVLPQQHHQRTGGNICSGANRGGISTVEWRGPQTVPRFPCP